MLIVALLIPLLSQGIVLELLIYVLRGIFFEAELHRSKGADVISIGITEAGHLSARDELFKNGTSALLDDGLGHHLKSFQVFHQVVLYGPIITNNLPIWFHHKGQRVLEPIHLIDLKDLVGGGNEEATAGSRNKHFFFGDFEVS